MEALERLKFKGAYTLLALDHRGSLFRALKEKGVKQAEKAAFEFKKQVLLALSNLFSGVLLDSKIGLKAWREIGGKKPYLLCLEKSGYEEQKGEKITFLEYTADELLSLGASACKLLLYFNPLYPSAKKQIEIGKIALSQCRKVNLPLFLEIVVYNKDNSQVNDELIVESVKMFLHEEVYPQVFKLQPPQKTETSQKITRLLSEKGIDWIVLTQAVAFEEFERRLKMSVLAGCKGFLAGRSIWQEGIGLEGKRLKELLQTKAVSRFKKIVSIATKSQ